MDTSLRTTPPTLKSQTRLRSRPVPRLTRPFDDPPDSPTFTSPSPKKSPKKSPYALNLTVQDLLLLPSSTQQFPTESIHRRKGKTRANAAVSPRNGRRARRRSDKEIAREEKQVGPVEEDTGKGRKRRQTRPPHARKEKALLAPLLASSGSQSTTSMWITGDDQNSLDGWSEAILDVIMWKNIAKSSLWFGFGSVIFLSSIFSGDVEFSIISAVSHLGLLILALAFFHDSMTHRKQEMKKIAAGIRLTEEDVLRFAHVIVPLVNATLAKVQRFFSGEPLMTLKVTPFLLFMANYGHLVTLRRVLATGFFFVFTVPKFCSCYSQQIQQRVEFAKSYISETWKNCSRKKLVATSAVAFLWNILSMKMRLLAAFMAVVVLRYYHQKLCVREEANIEEMMLEEQCHIGD
ncbi:hypothetical protein HPP92_021669 [Vanilla planifolia]|uniref:Reticulon-like protein n=1 Tax=Vanilla planifolia TaxID=51239 RepID=A0A835Q1K2_VANPL|nr:hypothetical protein HPP92_021669 [Vanilla planifolia]